MPTFQQAKRLIKIVVGFTVLILGVAMLVLPGPGLLVTALGLTILSAEFLWARRLLHRVKESASRLRNYRSDTAREPPRDTPS